MKKVEFNLEKAKAGAKLVTRNGKPVRVVCWDRDWDCYPILALVNDKERGGELSEIYTLDGKYNESGNESDYDLFILEDPTFRAYANAEEFLRDMKEHGPIVKSKEDNQYSMPVNINNKGLQIGGEYYYTYKELKDFYTWQDGHPCGVEEGGEEIL